MPRPGHMVFGALCTGNADDGFLENNLGGIIQGKLQILMISNSLLRISVQRYTERHLKCTRSSSGAVY